MEAVEEAADGGRHPRRLGSPGRRPERSSTGEPQAEAAAEAVDVLEEELSLVELVDVLSLLVLVLVEDAGEVEDVEPRLSLR